VSLATSAPGPVPEAVGSPRAVVLSTWLASRDQADWLLDRSGVSRLQPGTRGTRVLFHPEVIRVHGSARGIEAAKSFVLRSGHAHERVRVVNRTPRGGAIYAVPVRVIDALLADPMLRQATAAMCPGLMLADRLCARSAATRPAEGPRAVLLDLGAAGGSADPGRERLVIAVVYRGEGLPPATTCSLTVEPIEDIARLVLYEHRVPEGMPWVVFGPASVLAACAGLEGWPLEPEWSGVRLRRIRQAAVMLALALAAAGGVRATATGYQAGAAAREAAQWRERTAALQSELGELLMAAPHGFLHGVGLDPRSEIERARSLWREGTHVTVDADLRRSEYSVTLPLVRPGTATAGRAMAPVVVPPHRLDPLLAIAAPPGCRPPEPRIRGGLDEMAMVVVCPRPDSRLPGLLPG